MVKSKVYIISWEAAASDDECVGAACCLAEGCGQNQ